jgi:hypothetical protein
MRHSCCLVSPRVMSELARTEPSARKIEPLRVAPLRRSPMSRTLPSLLLWRGHGRVTLCFGGSRFGSGCRAGLVCGYKCSHHRNHQRHRQHPQRPYVVTVKNHSRAERDRGSCARRCYCSLRGHRPGTERAPQQELIELLEYGPRRRLAPTSNQVDSLASSSSRAVDVIAVPTEAM